MNLLKLSQNIRRVRLAQGMTVAGLAEKSGFSKGFISQVENFRQSPSLKALLKISDALGVSLSALFDEEENYGKEYLFGSLNEGEKLYRDNGEKHGISYLALAYRQIGRRMDPFVIEYTPCDNPRGFLRHDTEEFFVILEGSLDFRLFDDQNRHIMKEGDTLYLRANIPHRVLLAPGCGHAKALAVYTDPDPALE